MGQKERLLEYWRKLRSSAMRNEYLKSVYVPQGNPYHALCKKMVREAEADKESTYYEGIIQGTIQARTGVEKVIQKITRKDAGMVLAAIGLDHPASKVVLKYLGQQKLCQIDPSRNHILKSLISRHIYGLCIEDESDRLFKKNRELKQIPRYEATKEEIAEAMRRTREQLGF